mmetsp:Transcript_6568/g.19943  ORF Transcript_6568/g.19943 Transcript_6568/m.19943 type:complete len:253 (+) Transcript_6568:3130-3888(+)
MSSSSSPSSSVSSSSAEAGSRSVACSGWFSCSTVADGSASVSDESAETALSSSSSEFTDDPVSVTEAITSEMSAYALERVGVSDSEPEDDEASKNTTSSPRLYTLTFSSGRPASRPDKNSSSSEKANRYPASVPLESGVGKESARCSSGSDSVPLSSNIAPSASLSLSLPLKCRLSSANTNKLSLGLADARSGGVSSVAAAVGVVWFARPDSATEEGTSCGFAGELGSAGVMPRARSRMSRRRKVDSSVLLS